MSYELRYSSHSSEALDVELTDDEHDVKRAFDFEQELDERERIEHTTVDQVLSGISNVDCKRAEEKLAYLIDQLIEHVR